MRSSRERVSLTGHWIVAIVFLLGVWGILTVLTAQGSALEPLQLPMQQLGRLILALFMLLLAWKIPFSFYRKTAPALAALAYGSLVLLLFFGTKINGMSGWFVISDHAVQPSEIAKPFFLLSLLYLNSFFRTDQGRTVALLLATILWTIPILLQPDFGTTVVYWGLFLGLLILSCKKLSCLILPLSFMVFSAILFIVTKPYAARRITQFFTASADTTNAGWHEQQFQLTMAHGHWFGAQMKQAIWSNNYLPLSHNDSAYATMVEALGFLGALPVLLLIAFLCILLFRLSAQCVQNEFARNCVAGCAILLLFQSLLHLAVNATLIPITGLTLPFISYGGSSLVSCGIVVGIALSAGAEESGGK